jgi:hypothetical protein
MSATNPPAQPNVRASLELWHTMVARRDLDALPSIVNADAVFRSPMAHQPYPGREAVVFVLGTVIQVFENFRYHREFVSADGLNVTLEFSAEVGGKQLKGVDLIRFDEQGRICEFEVMVRPMSGLAALGEEMGRRVAHVLPAMKAGTLRG